MQKQKRTRPASPAAGGGGPASGRSAHSGGSDAWRLDPSDVARHAELRRRSEQVGPLGKVVRYLAIVIALGGAFAVYWNFDSLRQVTVQAPALSALIKELSPDSANVPGGGAPDSAVVESSSIAGAAAPTSVSAARDAERPLEVAKSTQPAASTPKSQEPPTAETAPALETAAAEKVTTARAAVDSAPPEVTAAPTVVEPPPPPTPETIGFALPKFTASERDAFAAVIVARNGGNRGASVFTWWTSDGTAMAGKDYVDLGRVVVKFAAGEQNRSIHIPIVGDEVAEGPESFYVNLAAGDDPSAEPEDRVEVVIEDDD